MSHPLPPKPSISTTANAPTSRAPPPATTPVTTFIPPTIAPNASVLLSGIALPQNPVVVCRTWTGPDDGIDAARKYITDVAAGAPDVSAALAALVRPDAELSLWAFSIVSGDAAAPRLAALDFRSHGLKETTPGLSRFDLAHLYPCSSQCDRSPIPCADCTKPRPATICPLARTAPRISRPVRRPLRRLYAFWLAALRSLVLDQIAHPRLLPTRSGVLVCPSDNPTGEWGKPWLDPTRTLTHAHVHISLAHPLPRPSTPSHILVHLLPQSTPLVPFPSIANPNPGTAVLLLPSSTPAYALTPYTGPAPHGFLSFLSGRGVQPSSATSPCVLIWLPLPPNNQSTGAASPPNLNALPTPSAATPAATATATGARGMYVVWPRALCVIDTSVPPIDVSKLPNLPTTLINTGTSAAQAPSKPRRFPTKKPSIPRPITLVAAQPPSPTTSTSLSGLANSASTLIDSIVRAREKEKEKHRARLERARSGSAVPIPVPSTLSGASTPTTATTSTAPPLHIQTQTPTGSALYPSPLANTPHHHLSPVTHTHAHASGVVGVGGAANMSPARSEGFGIGMDLFGDQEAFSADHHAFGVGMDVYTGGAPGGDAFGPYSANGGFGPGSAGGYDTATTTSTTGGGGAGSAVDLFGDLWTEGGVGSASGVEDPKSATAGRREDEDDLGALAEAEFDFFDSWGGPTTVPVPAPTTTTSATAPMDFSNLDLGLDIGLDLPMQDAPPPEDEVIDLDPTSPISSIHTPTPKPYFPLTPPSEDGYTGGGGGKGGMFDPLRFTQKFEGVDGKYRGVDGKFVFRLGARRVTDIGSAKVTDIGGARVTEVGGAKPMDIDRPIRPNALPIQLPPRSWSYGPAGQETPTSTALTGTLGRLQIRSRNTSWAGQQTPVHVQSLQVSAYTQSPQVPAYAQSHPPTYGHLHSHFQRGLPTPIPSPNSHRRLRAGYISLTNPSAKRLRTLRQAHTKTDPGTAPLSLFAKDWESNTRAIAPCSPTATLSDADSDSDSDNSDGGLSVAITVGGGGAAPSRGTSPPLSAITSAGGSGTGVPPGPALLLAHFRASALGSGALGEVLAWPESKEPKTPAPGPVSVPTPVSPGGIAEVSKTSVERAANLLTREAVDNWTWGTEFGAYTWDEVYAPSRAELVLLGTCLASVGSNMTLQRLIAAPKVEVVSEVLTDRPYPHLPRFEKLRHPKLAVGHSGQVTQMSPAVLRFWDTVGLEPVGGTKDVVAFAVFEGGEGLEEEVMVQGWLEKVGRVYESRKFGKHQTKDYAGVKKGIMSVRWDRVTESISKIADNLSHTDANLVWYIILPPSAASAPWFSSMLLKLAEDKFADHGELGRNITVHLVPATTVFNHHAAPPDLRQQLEFTALSVYERIQRSVGKRIRREILQLSFPSHTQVQVPAFTIARTLTPRFRFSMDWPDKQRETMDRHMFLHVAYTFSKSRRWLCAACVDERGEAHETKVWRVSGVSEDEDEGDLEDELVDRDSRMNKYVNLVWRFATRFAKRAGIEWRLVICRTGVMGVEELEAWNTITTDNLRDFRTGIHVSVLSFDHSSGLTFATGVAPSIKATAAAIGTPASVVIDVASNDFFILPGFDTDIRTNPSLDVTTEHLSCGLLPLATAHFLRLTDPPVTRPAGGKNFDIKFDDSPSISLSSQLHLLLVAMSRNSSLWKAGGDPWRELLHSFYSLSVLTRARMPSLDPLPFHLAMIATMVNVVDNRELVPVDSLSDC